MDNPLTKLRSIPPDAVQKLKDEGIETVEAFYEIAKHVDSRTSLSEKTGIPPFTLEGWSSDAGNFILMAGMQWS